jgi:hypothetical protein
MMNIIALDPGSSRKLSNVEFIREAAHRFFPRLHPPLRSYQFTERMRGVYTMCQLMWLYATVRDFDRMNDAMDRMNAYGEAFNKRELNRIPELKAALTDILVWEHTRGRLH